VKNKKQVIFMKNGKIPVETHIFPLSFCGKFPPALSSLYPLGFDRFSVSKNSVLVRKNQSTNLAGSPHLFFELEITKDRASLSYSIPPDSDKGIRRLHAALFISRILPLIPGARLDSSELAAFFLPALERASKTADKNYEQLSKKNSDIQASFAELKAKNARISKSSEQATLSLLELERQNAALSARVSRLESISDISLCELISDWLSSHGGEFDAAQFSKSAGIPPSRAEEGLERLLKSGQAKKISGGFTVQKQETHGVFSIRKQGRIHAVFSGLLRARG